MSEILDARIVWLRERLAKKSDIPNCFAELVGVYNPTNHIITISLVITIDGTEYRVIRCHESVIMRKTNDETTELRMMHRNMIAYMVKTYGEADWSVIIKKFIHWTTNPAHKTIMQQWVN
jgi:hypothetical protein